MDHTSHRCPGCQQPIWLHNDLWGAYYICEDCGWTCEDDEQLTVSATSATVALLDREERPRGRPYPGAGAGR